MSGPGDANTAMDIRDQALRVWRAVPRSDKVEWDHLFEIRHSNVDIFKKGHELLKGQGMLARLKPDYNTAPKLPAIEQPRIDQSTPKLMSSVQHVPNQVASTSKASSLRFETYVLTDCSGRIMFSTLFPLLTLATSYTPKHQPCYVPFAYRVDVNHACVYVVNTPDTNTGGRISELDIREACQKRQVRGLLHVVRCNDNVFTAVFNSLSNARQAWTDVGISLPSVVTPTSSAVIVKATYHLPRPPKIFSLDATSLDINHDTASMCVSRALCGGQYPAHYELLRQEVTGVDDDRMRYILRFDGTRRAPGVQQFHIPLDHKDGREKISVVFRPENIQACCAFCGGLCQQSTMSSTCPFTSVIGGQQG